MKRISVCIIFLILLNSCMTFKDQAIFDMSSDQIIPEHIENVYALDVFKGVMSGEQWFSKPPEIPTTKCLDVTAVNSNFDISNSSMLWSWDKKAANCGWMGIGFGWDGWAGKDLSSIVDKAAIQLKVKSKNGILKSLPLAACLEDYGGNQVWIGFHSKVLPKSGIKDDEWSYVTLPLSEFEWENAKYMDISNVKQFIVQFEASGDLYVNAIKIIPFTGGFKKRLEVPYDKFSISVDGKLNESVWQKSKENAFADYSVRGLADSKKFCVSIEMPKVDHFINSNKNDAIWNGDAIEIAFSSNPSKTKRSFLSSTDRHFGINLQDLKVWDWTREIELNNIQVGIDNNDTTTTLELLIPFEDLEIDGFDALKKYNIEFAINKSSSDGLKREYQYRWNSSDMEGFNRNPSLWGDLIFINN